MNSKIKNKFLKNIFSLVLLLIIIANSEYVQAIKPKIEISINNIINTEIQKYKKRAPDIFEIDENIIRESKNTIFAITLIQLNKLFDKYNGFTEEFIKTKRFNNTIYNKKFTIKLVDYPNPNTLANTCTDLSGINFSRKYYTDTKNWNTYENSVRTKGNCPCDDDKIIQSIISHEFGHVMEILYIDKHITSTINAFYCNCFVNASDDCAEKIKEQIIEKSNKDLIFSDIGTYGKSNSYEFFAEAFSTLQCSTNPKYKYIRNAVENIISSWF